MEGTLKVSPEELAAAASELSAYVSNMNECFSQMQKTMTQSVSYWVGEAGDAHRQLYEEQVEQTREIIARYTEHVRDLHEMTGIYTEAESTVLNRVEELPFIDL